MEERHDDLESLYAHLQDQYEELEREIEEGRNDQTSASEAGHILFSEDE